MMMLRFLNVAATFRRCGKSWRIPAAMGTQLEGGSRKKSGFFSGAMRSRAAFRLATALFGYHTDTAIFSASANRKTTNTRRSTVTGKRCASLAPHGAMRKLVRAMPANAGT